MSGALRVLLVGGPMYEPLYERLVEFERREGVRVEAAVAPTHPDLNERIEEEFGSGSAHYDLISTHTKYAPSQRQWLTPLDEDFGAAELEAFSRRTLELARIEGSLYGLPRNLDVKLLYYRTDLMDEPPRTWRSLLARATRLRRGVEMYGFVFPGKESGLFGHFFELHAMFGGRMFDEEGSPIPHMNDEAGRQALTLLMDLYGRAAPAKTPDWHYDEVAACFRDGNAAMSTDWPGGFYLYGGESSAVAGRHGVALYPEGPAGRFVYASSHSFAIPQTVQDRPAALELLRFLTSRESQAFEARLGTLPARTDALEDARRNDPPSSLEELRWKLLEETTKVALIPPKHENYPAVEDAIWEGIREALLGNKSVEQALEDTEEAARLAAEGESG